MGKRTTTKSKYLAVSIAMLTLSGCVKGGLAEKIASAEDSQTLDIKVTSSEFTGYLFKPPCDATNENSGSECSDRKDTSNPETIPFIPDRSCYGWLLSFDALPRSTTIYEWHILPGPLGDQLPDTIDGQTAVAGEDGKSYRVSIPVKADARSVSNSWCVAEGDHTGPHSIVIKHGGKTLHQFDFVIEPSALKDAAQSPKSAQDMPEN